ncbi:MAG: hypothetical protein RMI91_04725 [Gemmatales bacterium]|nr:hypothetical protein [Gemmatales bacterium]MDW7993940.1 hypothetical protein [Gemmatales bacterium]
MAAPLPVYRNPNYLDESSSSRNPAELDLQPTLSAQAAPDSVAEDDADVRSGMIISLMPKKSSGGGDPNGDLASLHEENRRLRASLEQARERLALMEREAARWRQREQEYEALLEEKSELIRQLHQELQLAKQRPAVERRVPREEELLALEQELLREREQLKRDEEQLMAEIRQMEVTLSRERADLARQRNELQRLHQQIQMELEMAAREATLRERLAPLYELHAELQRRYFGETRHSLRPPSNSQTATAPAKRPSSSSPDMSTAKPSTPLLSANPGNQAPASAPPAGPEPIHEDSSKPGFFRRLFGLG